MVLLLLPAAAAAAPAVGLLHLVQQQWTYSMLPLQLMPAGTPTRAATQNVNKHEKARQQQKQNYAHSTVCAIAAGS
jgi:hypothetical protein